MEADFFGDPEPEADTTTANRGGSKPIPRLPESEYYEDFRKPPLARNQGEIEAGHSFFGYVYDDNGPNPVLITTVPKDRPTNVERFRRQHNTSGNFLLRTDVDGEVTDMSFYIPALQPSQQKNPPEEQPALSSQRDESQVAHVMSLHQETNDRLRVQIDDLYTSLRQERDANEQLRQQKFREQQETEQQYRRQLDEKEAEIRSLKDEKRDLETKLELQKMEFKLEDKESVVDKLVNAATEHGGDVFNNVMQIFQQVMSQQQAAAGALPNPAEQPAQPQPTANDGNMAGAEQHQQTQPQMPGKQQIKEAVVDQALSVLSGEHPNVAEYANIVRQQISIAEQQGQPFESGDWMQLADALLQKAVEQNADTETVIQVLDPVLDRISQFKSMIQYMPPETAVDALCGYVGYQPGEAGRTLLINVINGLKEKATA